MKIPVGIEKQVVSTGFNNITTYGLKTKTINDQFSQFAKVVDRVEGSTNGTGEIIQVKNIKDEVDIILDYSPIYIKSHRKADLLAFLWDSLFHLKDEKRIHFCYGYCD
ncbi:hypothetical protein [Bacillus massilinigeriensis]|uniref:hypothetical protein n=1 Tax=Bacillus mediterraneensis TaxID=1805474 RepID=UPI0008F80579|nr:hypothetical protein [Bacillus mediterraneensis]